MKVRTSFRFQEGNKDAFIPGRSREQEGRVPRAAASSSSSQLLLLEVTAVSSSSSEDETSAGGTCALTRGAQEP